MVVVVVVVVGRDRVVMVIVVLNFHSFLASLVVVCVFRCFRSCSVVFVRVVEEEVIIDQIGAEENIKITTRDIEDYLHFASLKKIREFLYFKPINEYFDEPNTPLSLASIEPAVRREKTLNYMIKHIDC